MTKRYFGIHIPAWKRPDNTRSLTLVFALKGTVPSKKNMQVPSINLPWVFNQIRTWRSTNPKPSIPEVFKFIYTLIRGIKPYIRNPDKFKAWEAGALQELETQRDWWRQKLAAHNFGYPITRCKVTIRHYWSDRMKRDNSNKAETLHDMLVKTRIIDADDYTCLQETATEAACWKNEITSHITVIYVTAYEWMDYS